MVHDHQEAPKMDDLRRVYKVLSGYLLCIVETLLMMKRSKYAVRLRPAKARKVERAQMAEQDGAREVVVIVKSGFS